MRFEGTHFPGQHTTVVPIPQQIIVPERKIIGPAEAEKWHASRGSGVAADEGGGTPILLPGLAGGWAFTAGPQQTLSSAGVIASGTADATKNGAGTITYDSNGAHFPVAGDAWLVTAALAAFDASPTTPWFISAEVNPPNDIFGTVCAYTTAAQDYQYGFNLDTTDAPFEGASAFCWWGTGSDLCPITPGSNQLFCAWGEGANVYIAQNAGSTFSGLDSGYMDNDPSRTFNIGGQGGGASVPGGMIIRRVRVWIGDTATLLANTAAYRTWLYNAGNGRTDAEVAAYTG